jgi:hypothetical protein
LRRQALVACDAAERRGHGILLIMRSAEASFTGWSCADRGRRAARRRES